MALMLALDLGCRAEFYPVKLRTFPRVLEEHRVDIVMSGIRITTDRLQKVRFSDAYLDTTAAFVTRDYRRGEFSHLDTIRQIETLKIGIPRDIGIRQADMKLLLPNAQIHTIESARDYFGNLWPSLDAIVISAEAGSAWTLIFPQYAVVVPQPDIVQWPLAYPVAGRDDEMADFVNHWIDLKKKQRLAFDKFYEHWILGLDAEEQKPRWSVIRNVLHWVD
jgi:ABC-type amino acid transport substrate-binding protein